MMKLVLGIALAFSYACAFENSDEFINEINSKQNLWKAGRNFHKDTTVSQLRGLLGAKRLPESVRKNIPITTHNTDEFGEIPESFDARTQWAKCKTIKEVADQSACGSCWAVSVASAISDRICIHSDGKLQPEISARNLMSCEPLSAGCEGGFPEAAWFYWKDEGVVTGGSFGSKIGCQPYPFEQCEHHTNGPKANCPSNDYVTPNCVKRCDNSSTHFANDLHHGSLSYVVKKSETQIQLEILKNGPVVAGFDVYTDFLYYKSGVYAKTSHNFEGGHAVRMIGWGVENGTKYWLVANSWNEDWGDKGLFKIRRGNNECGIEEEVSAGLPQKNNFQ